MTIRKAELIKYLRIIQILFESANDSEKKKNLSKVNIHVGSRLEFYAKKQGLLSTDFITPMLTEDGRQFLKENSKPKRALNNCKNVIVQSYRLFKNIELSSLIIVASSIFTFLLLKSTVDNILEKTVYHFVFKDFLYPLFFKLIGISIVIMLVLRNSKRKLGWIDVFIFMLYVWYKFFDSYWNFISPFNASGFWSHLKYIDLILLYYAGIVIVKLYRFYRQQSIINIYDTGLFYPDLPIQQEAELLNKDIIEIDRESGLNRNSFAMELARAIMGIKPKRAFAIGISGEWGIGKTSLMSLINKHLADPYFKLNRADVKDNYVFIEFSPWFFNSPEALFANFFSLFESKASLSKTLTADLKKYAKAIATIEKSLFKTDLSGLLFPDDISIKERFDSIAKQIEQQDKIFIINIDDLDRLDGVEIVTVLKLIRLVANFPNTFYIVGYDKEYITKAIKKHLTDHQPQKYLEKIINIEYNIPQITIFSLRERIRSVLSAQLKAVNPAELQMAVNYERITEIIRNERELKRFSNNLIMRFSSIGLDVNFYHFFLLELINFQRPDLIPVLYSMGIVIDEKARSISENVELNITNNKAYNLLLNSPVRATIEELFSPSSVIMRLSICSEHFFYRYFSLNLNKVDFSITDFNFYFEVSLKMQKNELSNLFYKNPSLFWIYLKNRMDDLEKINMEPDLQKSYLRLLLDFQMLTNKEIMPNLTDRDFNRPTLCIKLYNLISQYDINKFKELLNHFSNGEIIGLSCFATLPNTQFLVIDNTNLLTSTIAQFQEYQALVVHKIIQNQDIFEFFQIVMVLKNCTGFVNSVKYAGSIEWFKDQILLPLIPYLKGNEDKLMREIYAGDPAINRPLTLELIKERIIDLFTGQTFSLLQEQRLNWINELYSGFIKEASIPFEFSGLQSEGFIEPGRINENGFYTINHVFDFSKPGMFNIIFDLIDENLWSLGLHLFNGEDFKMQGNDHSTLLVSNYAFISRSKKDVKYGDGQIGTKLFLQVFDGEGWLKNEFEFDLTYRHDLKKMDIVILIVNNKLSIYLDYSSGYKNEGHKSSPIELTMDNYKSAKFITGSQNAGGFSIKGELTKMNYI